MRTQDSLSRCDPNQYSSIYQVRQHPDFKNEPVFPSQKDTLQINKKELKKEALKRLNHSAKYTVAQQGFMRIGRVVFLAAALPPYLIFYKIPHLIVSQFIPLIFSSLNLMRDHFFVTIKQKMLVAVQSMKRVFKGVVQVWQAFTQPIFKVLFSAQKLGHSIYQKVASFFGEWNQQFKKVLNGIENRLKKIALRFKSFSKKSLQVQQWMTKVIKLPSEGGLEWVQTIFKQFSNKIQLSRHSANFSGLSVVKQQFKIKFEQAQRFATLFTSYTKRLLQPLQRKLMSLKKKIINRYHRFIQPLLNKMQKQQQLIKHFFGQKGEKWRAWIHSSTTKLKHITPPEIIVYLSSRLSFLWILKPFKSFFNFLLKHNFTKYLVYQSLKLVTLVLQAGLQIAEFVLNRIIEGWGSLKRGLHVIFSGMKMMIRIPIAYFNSFISLFKTYSYKGFYGGLVVIAMSVILFGWGIQLLATISTRIFSRIKFSQST